VASDKVVKAQYEEGVVMVRLASPLGAQHGLIQPSPKNYMPEGIYAARKLVRDGLEVLASHEYYQSRLDTSQRILPGPAHPQMQGPAAQLEDMIAVTRPNISVGNPISTLETPDRFDNPRRLPLAKQADVGKMLEDMQQRGVIKDSDSNRLSPVVLVRKKNGDIRFSVDYRKVSDGTRKERSALTTIDGTLDTLAGDKWLSTLDFQVISRLHCTLKIRRRWFSRRIKGYAFHGHAFRSLQCSSDI
jgi:hypothetical protein